MRSLLVVMVAGLLLCAGARAQDVLDTCHASSSYDVTITPAAVEFQRAQPQPARVRMHDGALQVDGAAVALDAADQGRIARFERVVRALEPRVKAIADQAVDVAASTVRRQAGAASGSELDARLDADARDLKARIARSDSTRDWQGPAFQDYVNRTIAGITPLLANELMQQAMTVAVQGDLDAAAKLRDRAASLTTDLQARLQRNMQVLRPRVQALCPSLQELDRLESGMNTPLPGGKRLDLIQVGK